MIPLDASRCSEIHVTRKALFCRSCYTQLYWINIPLQNSESYIPNYKYAKTTLLHLDVAYTITFQRDCLDLWTYVPTIFQPQTQRRLHSSVRIARRSKPFAANWKRFQYLTSWWSWDGSTHQAAIAQKKMFSCWWWLTVYWRGCPKVGLPVIGFEAKHWKAAMLGKC